MFTGANRADTRSLVTITKPYRIWILVLGILLLCLTWFLIFSYTSSTRSAKPCTDFDPSLFQVLPQFLSEDECDALIQQSKEHLKPAMVGMKDSQANQTVRNNRVCFLKRSSSAVTKKINQRLSALLQVPVSHFEEIQVGHYREGEFYKKHSDDALETLKNPRSFTLLMYLNDVNEGGQTAFPNLGIHALPRKGNAILFRPVEERNGSYHSLQETVHEAMKIERGEKWIATIWVHFQPYSS